MFKMFFIQYFLLYPSRRELEQKCLLVKKINDQQVHCT